MNAARSFRTFLPYHLLQIATAVLVISPLLPSRMHAQTRDFRTERIILDDNGDDGAPNRITIEAPDPLGQDVILVIPDLGDDSLQFLLAPIGTGLSGFWTLGGNAGTTAGTDFLGTTDATALHLYVNGGSGNSLILNTNRSLQRDVGGNGRGGDAVDLQISRNGVTQVASGTYATIGGGRRNSAINIAATVAGGDQNVAEGRYTTVGGGTGNTARSSDGFVTAAITVGGGHNNTATGVLSTIGGGAQNSASGSDAVIGGGSNNTISGQTNAILGGVFNSVSGYRSVIGGGDRNEVQGRWSAVLGGRGLTLGGDGSFGFLGGNHAGTVVSRGNNRMTVVEDDVALFGNVDLLLANNNGSASRLRLYEANSAVDSFPSGTTYYTSLEAGDLDTNINYVLPVALPTSNGQILASDITGVMSWVNGPAGPQSFSSSSNATSTLQLTNNTVGDDGTALEIVDGRFVMSSASGAPANIPDDVMLYGVNDAIAASAPTVGLPSSGVDGQLLYILVIDPDGATVGGNVRATGDRITYIYFNGGWQLFHAN